MIASKHKTHVRTEVLTMRQSISTVVTLLSRKKIPVTLSGTSAYVQSDAAGLPVAVNLPSIPDNATDSTLTAMRGFLDHEVAHILFTDFKFLSDHIPSSLMHLWNICEDIYIERKIASSLRGTGLNLNQTRKYVIKSAFNDAYLTIDLPHDQKKIFIEVMGVPVMRALCGQSEFADWLDDGNKWAVVDKIVTAIKDAGIADMINNSEHTRDNFAAAKALARILLNKDNEDETPFESNSKNSKSPLSNEDNSEQENDPLASGQEQEDGEFESEPSSSGDETETEAGTENEADDKTDNNSEDGSLLPEKLDNNDEKTDDEAFDFGDIDEPMSFESCLESAINKEKVDGQYTPLTTELDWIGSVADYGQAVGNIYLKTGDSPLHVNTMKDDINGVYGRSSRHFEAEILPLLLKGSAMAKEIERLILGREKIQWQGNRRTGSIHGGSLFKLQLGDNRVFRHRVLTKAKNACVLIVNDLSGSMTSTSDNGTRRIHQALASSYTIADAMDKAKIPCMVAGFTTIGEDSLESMIARIRERGEITDSILASVSSAAKQATRTEPLAIPIIKDWTSSCTHPTVNKNFGFCAGYRPLLRNNVDGESLLALLPLLQQRTEEVKIMLVLSDGDPAAVGSGMKQHLKEVTHYIENKTDIVLIGIGISTDADQYYSSACRVDNLEELPNVVCDRIKKAILH